MTTQAYAEFYLGEDCSCEQDKKCKVCKLKELFEEAMKK
jgi:hypothetical protein